MSERIIKPEITINLSTELREKSLSGESPHPELLLRAANQIDGLLALFSLKVLLKDAKNLDKKYQ